MNNQKKEPLLKVEHLCQYFRMSPTSELKAVDDVSFEIQKGEVLGLVGESGCGKTTTGRTIIKLYDATSGNVYFNGQRIVAGTRSYKQAIADAKAKYAEEAPGLKDNPEELKRKKAELNAFIDDQKQEIKRAKHDHKKCDKIYAARRVKEIQAAYDAEDVSSLTQEQLAARDKKLKDDIRIARQSRLVTKIQMIFQDPVASIDPRMTVNEIISEGLAIRGIKDKEYIKAEVAKALEQVGLVQEHAGRYPHEFSGGQKQRIGVARAIIMEPEMIIADEPVSALDVSIQAQVINLLNDLREKLGLTILFIAHDLSVVKYFSDRIAVMYYGKLVETATSDELFANPLHPYTRSLLSAIPLPDPVYEKNRKRIIYNPLADHDYSTEAPTLREVEPGHMVLCNTEEFERYCAQIAANGGPNAH